MIVLTGIIKTWDDGFLCSDVPGFDRRIIRLLPRLAANDHGVCTLVDLCEFPIGHIINPLVPCGDIGAFARPVRAGLAPEWKLLGEFFNAAIGFVHVCRPAATIESFKLRIAGADIIDKVDQFIIDLTVDMGPEIPRAMPSSRCSARLPGWHKGRSQCACRF